jgi:hypothetical protein
MTNNSSGVPTPFKMSESEVRVRFDAARKVFPMHQIAKLMKMVPHDLRLFLNGKPPRANEKIGPDRLKRLARICLDIETGVIKSDPNITPRVGVGRPKGGGHKHTFDNPPDRPPQPVHRVIFDKGAPALLRQQAPEHETMPSFKTLFGPRQKGRDLSALLKKW